MRSTASILVACLICAAAQAEQPNLAATSLGEQSTSQWRIGVVVTAQGGAVSGIVATMPVPMDWPEQEVKIVGEERSPGTRLAYRTLDQGVKQLVVSIPRLAAGEEASAVVTFAVTKHEIIEPAETAGLSIPPRPTRDVAKYLRPSPYIESTDSQIKSRAATIATGKTSGWESTAALFDWVRENVQYEFDPDIKPAITAFKAGRGDCEELTSLVIALCRASKIPARAVWVPGHCYPEFYLQDASGAGHWYPCQAAGDLRQFGGMVEERPILQKGDNFKVPGERAPQRYVAQRLSATNAAADPAVKWILERVEE
ncbi:MAG: transglutaminase-like domain-containing protein [Pirellulaceae bacterium]